MTYVDSYQWDARLSLLATTPRPDLREVERGMVYIWRKVDRDVKIIKSYIIRIQDKDVTLRFMKKTLKRHGTPEAVTTDGLRFYRAAMTALGNVDRNEVGRSANNQIENSHLPFRRREQAMRRFRRMKMLHKFASVYAKIHEPLQSGTLPHRPLNLQKTTFHCTGKMAGA